MDWDLVFRTVHSRDYVRSLEIGYRRCLLPDMDHVADIEDAPYFAVRLDGQDVVVDLIYDTLTYLLINLPVADLMPHLRRLAVLRSHWHMFDTDQLPALEELTLFIAPGDEVCNEEDFLPVPIGPIPREGPYRHIITQLRLVRVNDNIQGLNPAHTPDIPSPLPVSTAHIQFFISRTIAAGAMQRLILDGLRAPPDDLKALCAAIPNLQVAFEVSAGYLEADDCGPWKSFFPCEDTFDLN